MPEASTSIQKEDKDYLQIDFGEDRTLTAIDTQGYANSYVKSFKLMISHDGKLYNYYQDESGDKVIAVFCQIFNFRLSLISGYQSDRCYFFNLCFIP